MGTCLPNYIVLKNPFSIDAARRHPQQLQTVSAHHTIARVPDSPGVQLLAHEIFRHPSRNQQAQTCRDAWREWH